MRILLTGGTGFVGKNLIFALNKTEYQIKSLVRNNVSIDDIHNIENIDITKENWKNKIKEFNPEVVIHLAAFLTSKDDELSISQLVQSNIEFPTQLLDALKGCNVKYFINTGTFAEYMDNGLEPDPAYLYAAIKTSFRSILKYYQAIIQFKVVNVIPYTIYGGIDSQKKIIDYIYESISATVLVKMSPGEQKLDLIHIDDVVKFYLALLENLETFKSIYTEIRLGTGVPVSPKEISSYIEEITGNKTLIEWGGLPYRPRDTMFSVADKNTPSKYFKWTPQIDIKTGLKDFIQKKFNGSN